MTEAERDILRLLAAMAVAVPGYETLTYQQDVRRRLRLAVMAWEIDLEIAEAELAAAHEPEQTP